MNSKVHRDGVVKGHVYIVSISGNCPRKTLADHNAKVSSLYLPVQIYNDGKQEADDNSVSVVEVPHVKPLQSLQSTFRKPAHVTAPLYRCVSAPNLSYIYSLHVSVKLA